MIEDWYEKLRCPKCGRSGMASVAQPKDKKTPAVESVPDGFKVVKTPNGPDFKCETCDIAVE
ncbi:MAG: hypothetical protein QOC84_2245 [Bradyrhizobium sp.]|jgi:hypothetical protein|nr:hypothetical protein [Bradyrhizobium sp.]